MESIDVIFVDPEEQVIDEEAADFGSCVVEDERSPVWVCALPGVFVLV